MDASAVPPRADAMSEFDEPPAEAGLPGPAGAAATGAEPAFSRLDARVVPYWLVSGLCGALFLGGLAGLALLAFRQPLGSVFEPIAWIAAAGFGLLLAWQLIAPPLAWRRWRYSIDADLLVARYGIVFHEEKAIPVSRLQHVDLTRGPIERLFGLATLVVHTAGTEAASFRLPGLPAARAAELRDRILEARGDDVV